MKTLHTTCQCTCGVNAFHLRIKRGERVGLMTCAAGHHSLLLDSRDYWADVLQDGRPRSSRCRCSSGIFRVDLQYEFRDNGDVCYIEIQPECAVCGRRQAPVLVDIKYSPTEHLVSRPLDPIEQPWLQPRRRQITSFWKPVDAERFAHYAIKSLGARVFAQTRPYEFSEVDLPEVTFYPELQYDLLFTNIPGATVPRTHDPQRNAPFLRLKSPYHMAYSWPGELASGRHIRLLHYVDYSEQIVWGATLESQPATFLSFVRDACEWLSKNYVSLRGKYTFDNLEEYMCVKPELERLNKSRGS